MRLQGKVAIVTGGTRGIGAGIARRLIADGAKVVLNYHARASEAEILAGELGSSALAASLRSSAARTAAGHRPGPFGKRWRLTRATN